MKKSKYEDITSGASGDRKVQTYRMAVDFRKRRDGCMRCLKTFDQILSETKTKPGGDRTDVATLAALQQLDMDHIDPKTKLFSISDAMVGRAGRRSWEELMAELDKCQPLCTACHRIKSILAYTRYRDDVTCTPDTTASTA